MGSGGNQDIMQSIDFIWDLKRHISRKILDALLQELEQNLDMLEMFLPRFMEIKDIRTS